jgi:two-component system, chemotaxis family, CheB/CheR fusion protein
MSDANGSRKQRRDEQPDREFEALIEHIQANRRLDFRGYKRSSLRRRIEKRMHEAGAADFSTYMAILEADPQEYVSLLDTILINVTTFFRDAPAWDVLRSKVIPAILEAKREGEQIRVWSVGCAAGQETYSLAMLFEEALGEEGFQRRMKIYGTDLDEAALNYARLATYTATEVESVPADFLAKYFQPANGGYAFRRDLRKMLIFGRHNLVVDAPISRVDLIVCRNLLIYLDTETQNRVLPRLHYALTERGILFLGKAETQLFGSDLFEPIDLKSRIFRKNKASAGRDPMFAGGSREHPSRPPVQPRLIEAALNAGSVATLVLDADNRLVAANLAARRLLGVVDHDLGRPFQDLEISYRPVELRSRIDEASAQQRPVRIENQQYGRAQGQELYLNIGIMPLLSERGARIGTAIGFVDISATFALRQQLDIAQENLETTIEELQSTNEELETTNEELQSTNEELETTNEELQSANEELETINEELRSTNDELEMANRELRKRTEEAGGYRNYYEALLSSIQTGIVVLDRELRVTSWNRWNENAWGLHSDEVVGQRLFDLDLGLPVGKLRPQLEQTLDGGIVLPDVELDAVDRRGRSITCRIRLAPLRSPPREAKGLVLTVEDVSEQKHAQEFAGYLGRILGDAANAIYVLDADSLRFLQVNKGATDKLGYPPERLKQFTLPDLLPQLGADELRRALQPLRDGVPEVVLETLLQRKDGSTFPTELRFNLAAGEEPPVLVAIVHDITADDIDRRKRAEQLLEEAGPRPSGAGHDGR